MAKPYDWMVEYTPQREWIERQGILLWLAFFFIELGAGLYLASLVILNNILGQLIGWLITLVVGGGCHLLYLGRPLRFWRAVVKPQTSWIARGMIIIALFAIVGAIQLAIGYLIPQANVLALTIIMGIISFLVIIYGGFAMSYVKAIPFWNTPLLPVLYFVAGLWGGSELAMGIMLRSANVAAMETIEPWIQGLLLFFILLVGVYLWSIRYSSPAGEESVRRLVRGDLALLFYPGVVIVGITIPAIVAVQSFMVGISSISSSVIWIAIICELVGDLVMRYCILRVGIYAPLVPAAPGK